MPSQNHTGSGDNVAGNKTVNLIFKSNKKIIGGIGLLIILVAAFFILFIKEKEITGHLSYSNDAPIEQAIIRVTNSSGDVLHNSKSLAGGKFILSGLTFFDNNLQLSINNRNKAFSFNLDSLLQINSKDIVVKLSDQIDPYDIKYYNLEGYSVDYLLEGYLKNPGGRDLEQEVAFFRNSVFENLRTLKNRFSSTAGLTKDYERSADDVYVNNKSRNDEPTHADFTNKMGSQLKFLKKSIVGTNTNSFTTPAIGLYLMSNIDPGIQSIVYDQDYNSRMEKVYNFFASDKFEWIVDDTAGSDRWRYLSISELTKYVDSQADYYFEIDPVDLDFLKFIGNQHDPDEFMKLSFYYEECGGSLVSIIPSFLQVQVAAIENISNEVIDLNRIQVTQNPKRGLRTQEDEISFLTKDSDRTWIDIPRAISKLRAGSSIIIPLFIQFKNEHTFIYDPSLAIQELEFNNYAYTTRAYNPEELSIKYEVGFGSCPYVYTWSKTQEKWQIENHIIEGINDLAAERFDTLQIHQFDGRLLIREHDPETSYLNLVSVLGIDRNKNSQQFFPDQQSMIYDDAQYHIMNQGDSILLHFPDFKVGTEQIDYYVVSKGYYLVYQ